MKVILPVCLAMCSIALSCRADLTIVQKVEGAGPGGEVTMKIHGDKARVEAGADVTTIVDSKTGDVTTLMTSQKKFIQMSGEKVKAMAAMMGQKNGMQEPTTKPVLTPTGKKETINGFETEEYTCDSPSFKATYSIATKLPDGPAILKQLQVMQSGALSMGPSGAANYPDFPGVPIRSRISLQGKEIVSTISSIKQDPLSEAEFSVPKDYQAMQLPDMGAKPAPAQKKTP